MSRYRITEEEKEAESCKPTLSDAQAAYSSHKQAKEAAHDWSTLASKRSRTDASDRLHVEDETRKKLATRALNVLLLSGMVGERDDLSPQAARTLHTRLLKGLRARTLRLRIQSVERAMRWIKAAQCGQWFQGPEDVEEYLADLSTQKGVGVSTYERARYGLLYLESAAGRQPAECISLSPAVKNTIQELTLRTSSKVQFKKKEAPQWLVSMLVKLEDLIVNVTVPSYHRAYAWVKLVCFWCALRGDDATWIKANSIRYGKDFGFRGDLHRTKSTGPGKRVLSRPIVIGAEAYFKNSSWCEVGLALWQQEDRDRQNFILLPSGDGNSFRLEGAEPIDRVALTRILIRDYCLWDEADNSCPKKHLVTLASRFWTEHSSRASLPTMARAIGVEKAVIDKIGCWTSMKTTSDEYIRCGRDQVTKSQGLVAEKVRVALAAKVPVDDVFGEGCVTEDLKDYLMKRQL